MTVLETPRAVFGAMKEDYRDIAKREGRFAANRVLGKLALATTFTVPYMAGGLEATMSLIATHTYEATHRITTVAGATGIASFLIEGGLTMLIGSCMRRAPKAASTLEARKFAVAQAQITQAASSSLDRKGQLKRIAKPIKNAAEATVIALGAGSPVIMLRSLVRNPELDNKEHIRKGYQTAAILGGVNAALGAAAGAALDMMPSEVSEKAIEYVGDYKKWLGVLAAMGCAKAIGKVREARRAKTAAAPQVMPYDAVKVDLAASDNIMRELHTVPNAAPPPPPEVPVDTTVRPYDAIRTDLEASDAIMRQLHTLPDASQIAESTLAATLWQAPEPAVVTPTYAPFATYHNTIGEPLLAV